MLYQLRITIFDTQPKIWRRILIPTAATFWELHSYIQDLFHWNHTHLHRFWYDDKITKKSVWFGIPTDEDDMYDIEILPSWKHKMSKYLNLEEPNLKYVYDLGDNWMHLIELENILPAEKGTTYPICIGGKRNAYQNDPQINFAYAHTSGHATVADLRLFAGALSPKVLVPVHTESAQEFAKLYPKVAYPCDGMSFDI